MGVRRQLQNLQNESKIDAYGTKINLNEVTFEFVFTLISCEEDSSGFSSDKPAGLRRGRCIRC